MSDFLKIDNIVNMFKTKVAKDKQGGAFAFFAKIKSKKPIDFFEKDDEVNFADHSQIANLIDAAIKLGLTEEEALEALESLVKILSKYCKSLDVSDFILSNDTVKYPKYDENIKFNDKVLQDIEKKFPDLFLALKSPFKFFCKFPKTLTKDHYKKFTYPEILEFHRLHPEESDLLSNISEND